MASTWRPGQIEHNRKVRRWLAGSRGRFWGWEIVLMFYEVVIALDGYAEAVTGEAPKSHTRREAILKRHLPHLIHPYQLLYAASVSARYYNGRTMTEKTWREAVRIYEMLIKNIPVH